MKAPEVDKVTAVPDQDVAPATPTPVPCAARPSTGFLHLDGPCRCFFGGPPPEFAPAHEPFLAHAS